MKLQKTRIYVDTFQLRKLLKRVQYTMSKADRIIYGTPLLVESGEFLSCFVMAYDFPDERDYYLRKMAAKFEVLKIDLRIIIEENIIQCNDPANAHLTPDTFKIQIFEYIARIDESINKWKNYIAKGKTATE